jgi:ubiquinone/menaquinone biosynthesis C-methylase UbiE
MAEVEESSSERTRRLAAYYDRLADVYGEGEVFAARRAAVIDAVAAELSGAHAVLDLGCGNGSYAGEFVERTPRARLVGADLSADMLRGARRRAGRQIHLVQADAAALPFAAGSFDVIFMSHVLQLITNIDRFVADIATCLTADGLLIATVGVGGWRETMGRLLGPEALRELFAQVASPRTGAAAADQSRVATACVAAGLRPTWRRPSFSVRWPAVEEWVRIRWLSIVDEPLRARAEHWLTELRGSAAALTFEIAETLLVARKIS